MHKKRFGAKLNILLAASVSAMLICSCSFMPGGGTEAESGAAADSTVAQTLPSAEDEGEDKASIETTETSGTEASTESAPEDAAADVGATDLDENVEEPTAEDGEGIKPYYGTGLNDTGLLYAYNILSEDEKADYVTILSSLAERDDKPLLTLDKGEADYIYNCVMADHPELFYLDGYTVTTHTRGDKLISMTLGGNYSLDESEQAAYEEKMKPVIAECLEQAPSSGDYEKIKYVYEYVIGNTDYSSSAEHNQTIVSVFVNHTSVCNGYSKAVQYLLQRLGVETAFVTGAAKGSGHAWNMVKADGSWYYVDATWGDSSYTGTSTDRMWISYDYLCVTTQDIASNHAFSNTLKLPECTDRADNYYVRENAWFDTFDKDRFTELVTKGESQDGVIRLRCADRSVYDEIGQELIADKKIYNYISEGSSISYIQSDDMLTYTFIAGTAEQ